MPHFQLPCRDSSCSRHHHSIDKQRLQEPQPAAAKAARVAKLCRGSCRRLGALLEVHYSLHSLPWSRHSCALVGSSMTVYKDRGLAAQLALRPRR